MKKTRNMQGKCCQHRYYWILQSKAEKSFKTVRTFSTKSNISGKEVNADLLWKFKVSICKAFTLAEVLIVLGIIGIISEMTIPTLLNNVNEMQYKAAAKKAFSVSASAIQEMQEEEGGSLDYYHDTLDNGNGNFKPAFMKNFKVIKDCDFESCVPGSFASNIYKTLTGYPGDTADMGNDGQFVTADGMFFNIQQDGNTKYGNITIVVDINGYLKKPNVFGKDTFAFQLVGNTLFPMGTTNTLAPSDTYCNKTDTSNWNGLGCMTLVMQGIKY